jgi:hypothetical protein
VFNLPLLDVPLWDEIIVLPPPLFFATAELRARVNLALELFLRAGPAVVRDIRLTADPSADRYTGTAQLTMPFSGGPRATLQGSLIAMVQWLGLAEVLSVEGGLRAIGQVPLILEWAPSLRVIYDRGSLTFTLREEIDAALALLFDVQAFAQAKIGGDKVWSKNWNLYHWQWGRAVRFGSNWNLDYVGGRLLPPRVEPFAERFSVEELLESLKEPTQRGGIAVTGPGRVPPGDRLRELLGPAGGSPELILEVLADASPTERAAILGDSTLMGPLEGAVGPALWPMAGRILSGAPSQTTPSLSEGTVYLIGRRIASGRFQDALSVLVTDLEAKGLVDGGLAVFEYVRGTTSGEGLTTTNYDPAPAGARTPSGPSRVELYDPAFVNVPWLYSSALHEYTHVLQHQVVVSAAAWADPEATDRGEVEAYLWEIEHARGSGVIASPDQMRDVGARLTDHFTALTVPTQALYRARYDAAMLLVHDVTSGVLPVNLTYSVEDARRTVQQSSGQIAEKVRERPSATPARRAELDREIEAIEQDRSEALVEVVLAENPTIQIVDRARGIYRVPVTDGDHHVQWLYGSITVVWHINRPSPDTFTIGTSIRSVPPATLPAGVTMGAPRLLVGGSGVQGTVQPFPGDIDFGEEFDITAPSAAAAGTAMADTVVDFVARNELNPSVEFIYMRVMPATGSAKVWSREAILNPARRAELAADLAGVDRGKINTFWRVLLANSRYIEVTKVLGVNVVDSATGATLMETQWMGARFQEAYLDNDPPEIEQLTLAEYAALMRDLALKEAGKGHYLKAAKRAFNYLRAIGNVEGMSAIEPVFATGQAQLNQSVSELETVAAALDPSNPTRILTAIAARERLELAARQVLELMPRIAGHQPPEAVAAELRLLATQINGAAGGGGTMEPDAALRAELTLVKNEISEVIGVSLEARVQPLIERYVR